MKSLQQHISQVKTLHSLNEFISEKLVINKDFERNNYFVYKTDETKSIKIFSNRWPQFNEYRDKVYINGKNVKLDNEGSTHEEYRPGEYEINITDIDNITDCNAMFYACYNLTEVPLFDTRNVKNMGSMFQACHNLTEVPLFDTRNVIYMDWMFSACNKLTTVPLFDTRNVKDMNAMFANCKNLTKVPLFNTRNVNIMINMFANCNNLNKQTIQEWSKIYDFNSQNKI